MFAYKMTVVFKIQQSAHIPVCADKDIRPFAAVSAVGNPATGVFITVHTMTAAAPVSGFYIYLRAINEHEIN
jgi:hypothetical protein